MKSTEIGHQQIVFLEKLIKVLYWVMIVCLAVGSLATFITLAVLIGGGIAAGIFFGLLFGDALVAFILYIVKCACLIKIEYYDDIKYMRDYMGLNAKAMQNGVPVKGSINIVGEVSKDNINENNIVAPEQAQEYYIYSKTNSAYFVGITQNDGIVSVTYSKNKDKAMKFKTKTAALEFAHANKLNANDREFRIE